MSLLQKTIQSNGYSATTRCGYKIHYIIVHPRDTALELCARTAVMNVLFGLSLTSGTSVHGLEGGSQNTIEATAYHAAEKRQEGCKRKRLAKALPCPNRESQGACSQSRCSYPQRRNTPRSAGNNRLAVCNQAWGCFAECAQFGGPGVSSCGCKRTHESCFRSSTCAW